jgi:hypothetical protein
MLIEPASKVSVPFTVVMRIRSKTPLKEMPPEEIEPCAFVASEIAPIPVHIFADTRQRVYIPEYVAEAVNVFLTIKPVVEDTVAIDVPLKAEAVELYPVVTNELLPTCIIGELIPEVETPLNITVILLTQLGIPVKSMFVPDVEATAVPLDITPEVPAKFIVEIAII